MKNLFLLMISCIYIASIFYYQSIQQLPFWSIYFLLGSNILSFIFYGMDKLAAVKDWQRTPERHFYLLALCAGWPGSILGQIVFNHKTTKQRFRRWFYMMSLLNILLLGWYFLVDDYTDFLRF